MRTITLAGAVVMLAACGSGPSLTERTTGFVPNQGGSGGGGGDSGSPPQPCTVRTECPSSYTCEGGFCVPPEQEVDRSLSESPPVASPRYVYALNPTAASVARIEPASLAIEAIPVGAGPVAIAALPGEDAAVVLSYDDASLSVVDSTTLPSRVIRVPLRRQFTHLAVSPDGAFAIAWPDPTKTPSAGAEGIVTVIDLTGVRANRPAAEVLFERAVGYRVTDVVFRVEAKTATRAHVFAKSTVATIDLNGLTQVSLPSRLDLPPSMSADVSSREVVATADGLRMVLRSTIAAELAYFDGSSLTVVALPEVATDVDLLSDGSAAVAALRTAKAIAFIELPADIADPAGIEQFSTGGAAVGQVVLPPAGSASAFALIFSNVGDDESFARVDLPSGNVQVYRLEKWVEEISISPDGRSAIVIHRPNPASTATDPYERAVDTDHGYTLLDITTGYSQLKRTGKVRPARYAYSPVGGFAGVALRDDATRTFALEAVNLLSLVAVSLPLSSAPLFMGTVPQAPGISPHRVFVSQTHSAGRISVVQLDSAQVRTVTGFTLNAEIE
ncbi:MAG: YncE family protein [Myxococcota bacterium]